MTTVTRMPTRVLLVRHGQSVWNATGRWQGQADPPLTDLGRWQARAAARSLGTVDAVFASDLQRATETAVIIAGEIGVGPVVLDEGLRERDAGEWSGLTRVEIEEQWPGYLETPADEHTGFGPSSAPRRPPSWEPDDVVLARAVAALHRVREAVGDGEVIAVTHGGLIYVLEAELGAPFDRMANGGGRWIEVHDDRLDLGERVLLVAEGDAPTTVPDQI